ncbi:hypothetical protein LGM89_20115 [Burkholderia sp. AU31624]|uniref:hypothetical protein n=1 Tax=Burkholderia sp. AU31624 TaxID=2879629 RepID=UPI001CF3B2FB|nr:hypothetical protein [Burkholderia sp. AU31624]MCA8255580.1 hypothetical protein [Burkholderia sp. AU31624]
MIAYLDRADELQYAAPLRRLSNKLDKEIMRAGRMGNSRASVAPFSDEWRARETMKCRRHDVPSEPDRGSDKATKLPEFQRLTWEELRDAWSATAYKKNRALTIEQRFVLEVVHVRRTLRLMEKMVCAAELELKKNGYPDSFALDQLRHDRGHSLRLALPPARERDADTINRTGIITQNSPTGRAASVEVDNDLRSTGTCVGRSA